MFHSVAECKQVKMPPSNIAKIFGPTLVGYSSNDPDQHAIFTETIIQASVSFFKRLFFSKCKKKQHPLTGDISSSVKMFASSNYSLKQTRLDRPNFSLYFKPIRNEEIQKCCSSIH